MQIYEIKNDIAKILFNSNETIYPADFLYTEDNVSSIISQVIDIFTTEDENVNCATVKFLLSVDKNNNISFYNGYMPLKNSQTGILEVSEMINLLKSSDNSILWGNYFRLPDLNIETNINYLLDKPCVICDKPEQSIFTVKKAIKALNSLEKKVLVLDFDGKYKNLPNAKILTYGTDFKIPLNSKAFDYIFNTDLNDSPINSKITIQNIILELQKYVETTDGKFIPFELFMNIISNECQTSSDNGLLLFANKLAEYRQKKIFADNIEQFELKCDKNLYILDISDIDLKYHKLIFQILSLILPKNIQIISDISDANFDLTAIRNVYEKNNLNFIPVIGHECKVLPEVKTYCKNFVVFAPVTMKNYSEPYGIYLDKLSYNNFILWGENTLFIPFLVAMDIEEKTQNKLEKLNIQKISQVSKSVENQTNLEEFQERNDNLEEIDLSENQEELIESTENSENIETVEVSERTEEFDEENQEDFSTQDNENFSEEEIIVSDESNTQFVYDEITEEDLDDLDSLNSESYSESYSETITENYDNFEFSDNEGFDNTEYEEAEDYSGDNDFEEVKEDEQYSEQSEVFSEENQFDEEQNEIEYIEDENTENIQDVQDIQENAEETQEEQVYDEKYQQAYNEAQLKAQEQIAQNTKELARQQQEQIQIKQRENLPVYEPKEPATTANTIPAEGDRVMHAKYGTGTVEKIIRYGKKTLCSIQFDNVGRRLLDPNITTIEKM